MALTTRLNWRNALSALVAGIALTSASAARADDPDPNDPTLHGSQGLYWTAEPRPASPEDWDQLYQLVACFFPDPDWETVCYYGLQWYNVLPPEYPPEEPPPEEPPPEPQLPEWSPDTVVVSPEVWALVVTFVETYFAVFDYETQCFYALILFNVIPPS